MEWGALRVAAAAALQRRAELAEKGTVRAVQHKFMRESSTGAESKRPAVSATEQLES